MRLSSRILGRIRQTLYDFSKLSLLSLLQALERAPRRVMSLSTEQAQLGLKKLFGLSCVGWCTELLLLF